MFAVKLLPTTYFCSLNTSSRGYYLKIEGSSQRNDRSYNLKVFFEPLPDKDLEPNNSRSSASTVDFDFSRNLYLSPIDEDWFTFHLTEPALVQLSFEITNSLNLGLYQDSTLIYEQAVSENNGLIYGPLFLDKGQYHLRISPSDQETPYKLNLSRLTIPDAKYELNETYQEATPINLNFSERAQIGYDLDWYKLSFSEPTQLNLLLTYDSPDLGINISVHQLADRLIYFDSAFENPYIKVFAPGDYYFRLEGTSQQEPGYFDYQISLEGSHVLKTDILEPNNKSTRATVLSSGFSAKGLNVFPGDEDWFQFTLAKPATVEFQINVYIDSNGGNPIFFDVINDQGKWIRPLEEGNISFDLGGGGYFIKAAPQENAAAGGEYDLDFIILP